jgi:hypothetical protein
LVWWLPEDGTSVLKHVAVYICYKWCITQYIWWMIYWLLFNVALFHFTIKVATHKYRSTTVHDVSITTQFSAFNCAVFNSSLYVCYMWQWVEFTGCALWRLDRCQYPYCGRYVVCLTETYYAIVLCKLKTKLKIIPIASMTVGHTMDISTVE